MMRKFLSVLLCVSVLVFAFPTAAAAYTAETADAPAKTAEPSGKVLDIESSCSAELPEYTCSYIDVKERTLTISKYKGSSKTVTIPSTLKLTKSDFGNDYKTGCEGTYKVTQIYGFGNSNITEVRIPSGSPLKIIGRNAFANCKNLQKVTANTNSLKEIGGGAFSSCPKLTAVQLPDSITVIEDFAFEKCTSLKTFKVPANVKELSNTFYRCSSLTSVTLNNKLESIIGAFKYLGIKSITLPNSLKEIGADSFNQCSNLTSITIPKNVTKIGRHAFQNCKNLKTVTFAESSALTYIDYGGFGGCAKLETVTLSNNPNGTTTLDWYSFSDCTALKKIVLPDSVREIHKDTFNECNKSKLTIYAYANSTAYHFAKNNGIKLVEMKATKIFGDLDGDNKVTSADSLKVLRYSVNLETPNATQKKLSDVDGDGKITSADALAILRYSVNIKESGYSTGNKTS